MSNSLSLFEEDFKEKKVEEAKQHFVLFSLSDEWYALPIQSVREIIPFQPISLLPNLPEYFLGIINFRGTIFSVLNLKLCLGLPSEDLQEKNKIILIEEKENSLALLVDGSVETIQIPISKIEKILPNLQDEKQDFLEGQIEWNGKLSGLLKSSQLIEKTKIGLEQTNEGKL